MNQLNHKAKVSPFRSPVRVFKAMFGAARSTIKCLHVTDVGQNLMGSFYQMLGFGYGDKNNIRGSESEKRNKCLSYYISS